MLCCAMLCSVCSWWLCWSRARGGRPGTLGDSRGLSGQLGVWRPRYAGWGWPGGLLLKSNNPNLSCGEKTQSRPTTQRYLNHLHKPALALVTLGRRSTPTNRTKPLADCHQGRILRLMCIATPMLTTTLSACKAPPTNIGKLHAGPSKSENNDGGDN